MTMSEVKIWAISVAAVTAITYLPASFAMWDFDPGSWPYSARGFIAFFWAAGILILGSFPGWRWPR